MDAVFDRYMERIYLFLYRRVGNREDAEDLTSEVFLKASGQLDTERSEASIAHWLFTVARTVLADHWRRYYRHGSFLPLDEVRAAATAMPVEAVTPKDDTESYLERVLSALPERYRRVLELRFLSGMTIRETAEVMGLTPENVKVIQHRALARAVATFNPDAEAVAETADPEPHMVRA
jgi:RNA polymerase sigma-70 factor (ECF subfamily)